MPKVVYNACYGGFSMSMKARDWLAEKGLKEAIESRKFDRRYGYCGFCPRATPRHHPLLVQCVEELGKEANGDCAELDFEEVNGPYMIEEFDGKETIRRYDSDIADSRYVDPDLVQKKE